MEGSCRGGSCSAGVYRRQSPMLQHTARNTLYVGMFMGETSQVTDDWKGRETSCLYLTETNKACGKKYASKILLLSTTCSPSSSFSGGAVNWKTVAFGGKNWHKPSLSLPFLTKFLHREQYDCKYNNQLSYIYMRKPVPTKLLLLPTTTGYWFLCYLLNGNPFKQQKNNSICQNSLSNYIQ